MPVRDQSNQRVIPANARASDVAANAIKAILPVQQSRNYSAIRVQGYTALLYNHLTQGKKCTCQSAQKTINTRLGIDGKARPGVINELLTGAMTFDVSPYGSTIDRDDPFSSVTSPDAINKFQGQFDIVGDPQDHLPARQVDKGFGDNGPLDAFDINDLVGDFDINRVGMTDATCGVCFGHGFVGGYTPFHATRLVFPVDTVELGASEIDTTVHPWAATGPTFSFTTVLPFGAIGVDTFRVLNNHTPVTANFTIDNTAVTVATVISKCDGRPHTIAVTLPDKDTWTHVEIQFITSDQSVFFEFPKLNKGNDTSLLEQLDPFSVVLSSNVPSLRPQDIIVESTFGKTLIVENSNWWNTRERNVLGWECQVRVLQPQEIYTILPKRGRVLTKPPTSLMSHENITRK